MEPELAAALLGAFVGAIGGGAASLAGSVIVNRLQLRREMRIRMYDELLPKLIDGNFLRTPTGFLTLPSAKVSHTFERVVEEMERASVIAGRTDAAKVWALHGLVIDAQTTEEATLRGKMERVGRAVFELNEYLARKLV